MANGEDRFQTIWQLALVSVIAGTIGGFGWRQIDPSTFTRTDSQKLIDRVTQLEIKTGQLPPVELLRSVDRLEYRMELLENDMQRVLKDHYAWMTYFQEEVKKNNRAQSHGK